MNKIRAMRKLWNLQQQRNDLIERCDKNNELIDIDTIEEINAAMHELVKNETINKESVDKLQIVNFKNHIYQSTNEMLDANDERNDKYNFVLNMNGKELVLQHNADLFENIMKLLDDELAERSE